MTSLNLNIADSEIADLTGPELKAHISAIQGFEQTKIASKSEGVRKLSRLRMWARNEDGLLGIPKDTKPQIRSMEELKAKAAAKGKTLSELPKANDKLVAFDPEFDDIDDQVDGVNESAEPVLPEAPVVMQADESAVTRPGVGTDVEEIAASHGTIKNDAQAEADRRFGQPHYGHYECEASEGDSPGMPAAPVPDTVVTSQGVEVKIDDETIVHKRGTMRARLAQQAAAAPAIVKAASAERDRRPKKETGEARKPREQLLGVKATFTGLTKNHAGSMRKNILVFIQTKATRQLPGWKLGAVPIGEIERHFDGTGKAVKPFIHKLIEDGHCERAEPVLPE
jgi:hypothetical protein